MSVLFWGGVGPQVNKFEQVFSNDHQISVAGEGRSHVNFLCGRYIMIERRRQMNIPLKSKTFSQGKRLIEVKQTMIVIHVLSGPTSL